MAKQGTFLFTCESVSMGHPDKMADQMSDGILDAILAQDPTARVACEAPTTGLVLVAGEITTTAPVDYTEVVRQVVREIGYTSRWASTPRPARDDRPQPPVPRHRQGRQTASKTGGNSGELDGKEHRRRRPGPDVRLRLQRDPRADAAADRPVARIFNRLTEVRQSGEVDWLRPDSKSQVTVEYDDDRAGADRHGGRLHAALAPR